MPTSSENYLESLTKKYKQTQGKAKASKPAAGSNSNPLAALRGITVEAAPQESALEKALSPQSRLGKVIDVLSRPAYAMGNVAKNAIVDPLIDATQGTRDSSMAKSMDSGENPLETAFDATVGSALSGLAGRSKTNMSKNLDRWEADNAPEKVAKFVAGLTLDIGTDPLTYIPGAAFVAGGRGAMNATKAVKAASTADKGAKGAAALTALKAPTTMTTRLKKAGTLAKDDQALPEATATVESIAKPRFDAQELLNNANARVDDPNFVGMANKPEPFKMDSFTTSIQDSVKNAAKSVKTDEAGKRVYDFKTLPNMYTKPRAAVKKATTVKAAKEESLTGTLWAKANAEMPIARLEDGTLRFSEPDANGLTLGKLLEDAQNSINPDGTHTFAAKQDFASVSALMKASTESSVTGTAKTVPDAVEAAGEAAAARSAGPRSGRIIGAEAAKRLSVLKDKLSPEDYATLMRTRSDKGYRAARQEILSRTLAPAKSHILEAPVEVQMRRMMGQAEVAPAAIAPRQVLNATDPAVIKSMSKTAKGQFAPDGMKYRSSIHDTARSNKKMGKGTGISDRGLNKRAQYEAWRSLVTDISSKFKAMGKNSPKGLARGNMIREEIIPQLDQMDAVWRSRGIEPILGSHNEGIALSFGDIIKSMDATTPGRTALLNHLFDITSPKGTVGVTNLMDGVQTLFEAMRMSGVRTTADIPDFLRTLSATSNEADSLLLQIKAALIHSGGGDFDMTAEAIARRLANKAPEVNKGIVKRVRKQQWVKDAEHPKGRSVISYETVALGGKELNEAADSILKALISRSTVTALVKANIANSARYNAQLGYEVQRISEDTVTEFFKTWTKAETSTGEAILAYRNVDKAADAAADSIKATPAARDVAGHLIKEDVTQGLADDIPAIENITAIVDDTTVAGRIKLGLASYDDFAAQAIEDLPIAHISDVGENSDAAMQHYIFRAVIPFLTKNPNSLIGKAGTLADKIATNTIAQAGHATIRAAMGEPRSVVRNLANSWQARLTEVHMAFPKRAELAPYFARIQKGEVLKLDGLPPAQAAALKKLESLSHILFDKSVERGTEPATGLFFRNALDLEHVNGRLAMAKLDDTMRFDPETAKILAEQNGTTIQHELGQQWKTWEIEDPIDFLAKIQHAATAVTADSAIARDVARIGRSKGLMSDVRRDGFVQISDSSGKSVVQRYLPESAWYHPDLVEEIKSMDKFLQQSLVFDSPVGMFVNKYLDPFLNMWKAGMTIYRPGHHVRNLVGDSGLSHQADGFYPAMTKQPRKTMMIMAMRDNYDDYSALRALQGMSADAGAINAADKGTKVLRGTTMHSEVDLLSGKLNVANVVLKGNKKVALDAKTVHDYVRSHGMLPDFLSGEDLLQSSDRSSDTIRAIQESLAITGGNVRKAAGQVSESREDFVRLNHFLQIIEKPENAGKFATTEELMAFATARVRKWHPDGTDLTPFETKVMRRVFPFYSWTKKSIPLVVESLATHPGRVMMYPKAMYNMAEASGIDPLSMGDPFPEDKMYPSFLKDNMTGPVTVDSQGRQYGASPGIASADLMNQFVGAPGTSTVGMMSPFIKAPIELRSMNRLDTGSTIKDKTEYISSLIPGPAQVNNLTGVDWLGSLIEGQGIKKLKSVENDKGEPTGNREQLDPNTFVNFMTGLGISNMSKPSYTSYAKVEQSKIAADKAKKASGQ